MQRERERGSDEQTESGEGGGLQKLINDPQKKKINKKIIVIVSQLR